MNRSLGSSVTLFLIFSLAFAPCLNAGQLEGQVTSATQPTTKLSDVITSSATVNLVALLNKLQDGTAQAADVRGALVAVSTLIANMQETGANDQITAQILAQEDSFLNEGISEEQIQKQIASLMANGAKINPNHYRNGLLTTQQQRQATIANIKKNGMWGVEQQFLTHLQRLESTLQPNGLTGSRLTPLSLNGYSGNALRMAALEGNGIPRAHLQRILVIDCATLAAAFGIAAVFTGNAIAAIVATIYWWESAEGLC